MKRQPVRWRSTLPPFLQVRVDFLFICGNASHRILVDIHNAAVQHKAIVLWSDKRSAWSGALIAASLNAMTNVRAKGVGLATWLGAWPGDTTRR
jgi:hypothetical protein